MIVKAVFDTDTETLRVTATAAAAYGSRQVSWTVEEGFNEATLERILKALVKAGEEVAANLEERARLEAYQAHIVALRMGEEV